MMQPIFTASDQLPPAQMPPRRFPVAFSRPAQMPAGTIAGRDNCRPADFRFRDISSLLLSGYILSIESMSKIFFNSGHVQNISLFRAMFKIFFYSGHVQNISLFRAMSKIFFYSVSVSSVFQTQLYFSIIVFKSSPKLQSISLSCIHM